MKSHRKPNFLASFLLSLPISVGLPYVMAGMTMMFMRCDQVACLATGFMAYIGCLLVALPAVIGLILVGIFDPLTGGWLQSTIFWVTPFGPFSSFEMQVLPTYIGGLVTQIVFWALVIHLLRVNWTPIIHL